MKVTLLTLGKCTSVGSEHSWLTYLHFLFTHTLLYYECGFLWPCLIWGNFLSSWVTGIEIQVQKKTAVHVDSDCLLVEPWNSGVPRQGGDIREHTSVCDFASVIGEGLEFDCPVSCELSLPLWVLVLLFCFYSYDSYDGDFSFYSSFVLCKISPTGSFSFCSFPFLHGFYFPVSVLLLAVWS